VVGNYFASGSILVDADSRSDVESLSLEDTMANETIKRLVDESSVVMEITARVSRRGAPAARTRRASASIAAGTSKPIAAARTTTRRSLK
jgi:hypothetical protein